MTPFIYLIIGVFCAALGTFFLTIGASELKRRDELYALATLPTIEVSLSRKGDEVIFRNNSSHPLISIEAYSVGYKIDGSPKQIINRTQPSAGEKVASKLKPNEIVSLPTDRFTFWYQDPDKMTQDLNFLALVIIFRRELDNRRFTTIEPFSLVDFDNDGKRELMSLYAGNNTGISGPPKPLIDILKEITETEKIFFRIQ